jgi:hypothetical protein
MAAVGGRERTEQESRALLTDTGLVLAGIRPFHGGRILEAVPQTISGRA